MNAVAFMEAAVPQPVIDLNARSLGSDEDRAAWLEARTHVITATEAKLLVTASNATARKRTVEDLIAEKLHGSTFTGNHFTHWGNLREPVIIAELEQRYGLRGCGLLVHAEDNSRHAATPDAAGVDFDGLLVLAEIKTSKNDVTFGSEGFDRAGYFYQMQWQMYCAGAQRVLYVVERHDNDWLGWDLRDPSTWLLESGPRPEPIVARWVERDDAVIARMIECADEALAVLDAARAAGPAEVAAVDPELDLLAGQVLAGRTQESMGKRAKETAWKALQAVLADRPDVEQVGKLARVRWTPAVSEFVDVPDEEAAAAAFPKEHAALVRAEKRAEKLRAEWSELTKGFTKKEERVGRPSLSVTAPKKGKKS